LVASILRIFPFFSGILDEDDAASVVWESKPISSRKLHGWTTRGDEGDASETRRCFNAFTVAEVAGDTGNGALKENVDEEGIAFACGWLLVEWLPSIATGGRSG